MKRAGPSALLLSVTLILTAVNLRAGVTSVGPLLRDVQEGVGMSDTVAGVLTTLPVLCFGVMSLLAGRIARRAGIERTLLVAMALIAGGLLLRAAAPSVRWLLTTTVLMLLAGAVANVVVPVAVRTWFPLTVGRVTGWYSMALVVGSAVPAAAAVPVAQLLGGWRWGLGFWGLPAALTLGPWLLVTSLRRSAPPPPAPIPAAEHRSIYRSRQAWALTVFFGLQSLEAYVAVGWFSAILRDAGVSPARAGLLLGVALGLGAPVAILLPRFVGGAAGQRAVVVALVAASAGAYLGLLLAPAAAPMLWALLLGVGLGAFPMALMLIGLRAGTASGTADLSALVQGAGYLIAAFGPLAVGRLHDVTGEWTVPLGVLLVLLVPKLWGGLVAAEPGLVDA